ncbi:hypothetical protein [Candidatus Nitrospira bockiana]
MGPAVLATRMRRLLAVAGVLGVSVLLGLLDVLLLPRGLDPILYVIPAAWIALWSARTESRYVLAIACLCSGFVLAGGLRDASMPAVQIGHRLAGVGVLWVIAALSLARKRVEGEVRMLRGLLPICVYCKKIRDDHGYWKQLEVYIASHSEADFSHGLCPECGSRHYPDILGKEGLPRTGTRAC